MRETCDLDMPSIPRVFISLSTRRVETPASQESATTQMSAFSARRRGSSSQAGK